MMDTVYGTKKYFQSLSGASDIYRSSTCRAVTNEYSSYQNTLGRRSTLGPYTHMTKHPSYSTDLSLGSQYGYSTWGIWRDPRNMSPSTYSSKSRQSVKSFSIILTTAAFIVLLAVISIAGLAFYFSTFKSNLEDPIMAFEGTFRILKGDSFTTGMKYNHTSTYKQKHDFYKRFVERSLSDNGLQIARVDITGFGDGPLINCHFRAFLDMRKLPQNIHSVEEHIRESLFLETTSIKSLYKSLRIDPDSVEVKRVLDDEVIKSASFSNEPVPSTSQTHFEKRLTKKTGTIEKTPVPKSTTTSRPQIKSIIDDEPEVDVENAPVIQGSFEGSFEITKTDADITRKKTSPTKSVTTSTKPGISVTPTPIRVKTKKTTIEKLTTPFKTTVFETTTGKIPKKTLTTTTTKKIATSTAITSTTTAIPTTTTTIATTILPQTTKSTTSASDNLREEHFKVSNVQDPPRLDASLFTSSPVLDTEPWRPIRPSIQTQQPHPNPPLLTNFKSPPFTVQSQPEIEAIESGLLPRHKMKFSDPITDNPNEMIFYHSFTNPVFMPGTAGIEKLGNADVKPHPLPVPLIDDVVIPAFKPLGTISESIEKLPMLIDETKEKFQHIGGGVIMKKHDENATTTTETPVTKILVNDSSTTTTTISTIKNISHEIVTQLAETKPYVAPTSSMNKHDDIVSTELSETIGDLLYDLLDIPKDRNDSSDFVVESRIEPDSQEKPNFLNIKEHILNKKKIENDSTISTSTPSASTTSMTTSTKAPLAANQNIFETATKRNRIQGRPRPTSVSSEGLKTTPVTFDDSMLFPSHSKWEYVNGSSNLHSATSMKKVFNKTLQAWVVENVERPENLSLKDLKLKTASNNTEIQDIALIFDTLASKLGISPSIQAKVPPFISFSQNKLKQSQRNDTRDKVKTISTSKPITITKRTTTAATTSTIASTTTSTTTTTTTTEIPSLLPMIDKVPEVIVGEAEIEVVDPTKYEEMLSSQSASTSTSHTPTLVTLLPVRSNSGIRTYRPLAEEARRFNYQPRYRETVVKTGIHVTT